MQLKIIETILFRELMPWLEGNNSEPRYISMLDKITRIPFNNQCRFKLEFAKPYSKKLNYYDTLIWNDVIEYYNEFVSSFKATTDSSHQAFIVDRYLQRELQEKMRNTFDVIQDRLSFESIRGIEERARRETNFILDRVRWYLTWLYVELKAVVEDVVSEEYHDIETICAGIFDDFNVDFIPIILTQNE